MCIAGPPCNYWFRNRNQGSKTNVENKTLVRRNLVGGSPQRKTSLVLPRSGNASKTRVAALWRLPWVPRGILFNPEGVAARSREPFQDFTSTQPRWGGYFSKPPYPGLKQPWALGRYRFAVSVILVHSSKSPPPTLRLRMLGFGAAGCDTACVPTSARKFPFSSYNRRY